MWQSLHDAWWRQATSGHPSTRSGAFASSVLSIGSAVYRTAVTLRNAAYDRRWLAQARLACPVVSVGNLTLGGTGKTSCVELIAKKLSSWGKRVAILSRGYGEARSNYWLCWEDGRLRVSGGGAMNDSRCGLADEPQLLARHLAGTPIFVGARRDEMGRVACQQFSPDAIILDDGFQHRRIRRDCDVVLVNARMPLDGWAMLPRGPMREPVASLKRADVVIITKVDEALPTLGALSERLRSFNPSAVYAAAVHEPARLTDGFGEASLELKALDGLRVGLLSSIGDPDGFEATVRRLHATVIWHRAFSDHYRYREADWIALMRQAHGMRPEAIVTTEKDWVRLQPVTCHLSPVAVPLWVLGVRMKILEGEAQLDDRLASVCAS
jgi:tetraacyldisaccharide 4'-kinase